MDWVDPKYIQTKRIIQNHHRCQTPINLPVNYTSPTNKIKQHHNNNPDKYRKDLIHFNQCNKIEIHSLGLRISSININGLVSNFYKQQFLLKWLVNNDIDILCLQEWCIHHNHDNLNNFRSLFPLKQFDGYEAHVPNFETAILYKNSLHVFPHPFPNDRTTEKQWRAWISVYNDNRSLNVCSYYHSPSDSKNNTNYFLQDDIKTIQSTNKKFTNYENINGDFNGHNEIWDRTYSGADVRGAKDEDWLITNDLHLLNDGSPTYCNRSTHQQSAIDLSIASSNLLPLVDSWYINYESRTINVNNRNKAKHDISLLSSFDKKQHIIDFSDHYFIVINIRFHNIQQSPIQRIRFDFRLPENNIPKYHEFLQEYLPDFDKYFNIHWRDKNKLDDIIIYFQSIILLAGINSFGTKIVYHNRAHYTSKKITHWLRQKKYYQRKLHRKQNQGSHYANNIKRIIKKLEKKINDHRNKLIDFYSFYYEKKIDDIQYKDDKTFYNLCHHQHKDNRHTIPPLRDNKNEIIAITIEDQAKILHNHFNRTIKENAYLPRHQAFHQKIENIVNEQYVLDDTYARENKQLNRPIEVHEIYKVIKEAKLNTATGFDHICQQLISWGKAILVPVLKRIFNLTYIIHKTCPNVWKASNIHPIPKPGRDNSYAKNNRPISLMPLLMRIFSKILCKRFLTNCIRNNRFKWWNNGFQPNKSCDDILIRLTEKIYQSFDTQSMTEITFMDIQSAYDTVWIPGLIYKLKENFNISGTFLIWMSGYLIHRFNRVTLNNHKTEWKITSIGLPQGDPMSPPLWCVYIDDYEIKHSSIDLNAFADDMSMSTLPSPLSVHMQIELQNELDNFYDFTLFWRLIINAAKCNTITLTHKQNYKSNVYNINKVDLDCVHAPTNAPVECTHNQNHPLYKKGKDNNGSIVVTNDTILIPSEWQIKSTDKHNIASSVRILGLYFDPKLNWNDTVNKIKNKFRFKLYHLKRIAYSKLFKLSPWAIWKLHLSTMRPIMEYGITIYSSSSLFSSLETFQNQCARTALRINSPVPNTLLRNLFNITPLHNRMEQMQIKQWNNISRSPKYLMKYKNFSDWKNYINNEKNSKLTKDYNISTRLTDRSENNNLNTTRLQFTKKSPISRMYECVKNYTDNINNLLLEYELHPLKAPPNYYVDFPTNSFTYDIYQDFEKDYKIEIQQWEDENFRRVLLNNNSNQFWNNILFYSDGSCDPNPGPGGYGCYCVQNQFKKSQYIDHPTTINYCELMGIYDILQYIQSNNEIIKENHTHNISILTDSSFCVNLFNISGYTSEFYYWNIMNNCLKILNQFKHIKFNIVKVPAHKNIIGNEIVDKLAKEASKFIKNEMNNGNSNNLIRYEKTPAIVDTSKMLKKLNEINNKEKCDELLARMDKIEKRILDTSVELKSDNLLLKSLFKRDSNYFEINKFASKCLLNDLRGLRSLDARIISKLRTETANLNQYLKYYVGVGDGICKQCNSNRNETVKHYLIDCDKYTKQRIQWRRKLSKLDSFLRLPQHFDAIYLLFPHYWQIVPSRMDKNYKEKVKTNEKVRMNILETICVFVKETKRFENKYGI